MAADSKIRKIAVREPAVCAEKSNARATHDNSYQITEGFGSVATQAKERSPRVVH